MPRLLISSRRTARSAAEQPAKKTSKKRSARSTSFDLPHSPWQKLIDSKRREKRLTYRALGEVLKVNPSVIWQWLHSKNGFPAPYAFTDDHLRLLSEELGIPMPQQKEALDASRRIYTAPDAPAVPMPSQDHFKQFLTVLKNDRRKFVSLSYVINLAETFYALGVVK